MLATRHIKFHNRVILHAVNNMKVKTLGCTSPSIFFDQIPVFDFFEPRRPIATTVMMCAKTRKMVKNKNIRKGRIDQDADMDNLVKSTKIPKTQAILKNTVNKRIVQSSMFGTVCP